MKAFVSWSGGKESAFSYFKAMKEQNIKVTCLLNMISEDGKRSRSHGIIPDLLKQQAKSIGVRIVQKKTSWETYENVFKKSISALKKEEIQAGIFGDIDLQEHRDWVEKVCNKTGIKSILPLWKLKRKKLIEEFIQAGFKAIVVVTDASFLNEKWLGRDIDNEFVEELKVLGNIDICGEKGEYHTFVYDGPIFKEPVRFIHGKKILKNKHWFLNLALNV